ncbi:hypothetical protein [Thiocystis violacea]|uniref:hypothetical protein n=1 Tax=Thiocystis violacea TaxID=13725 RepID=UPI00190431D8|nr:hypothetical protein [Thiocystis violacea]MBK1719751.1 hypothetical protein [Thiocystis violacea]
MRLIEAEPSLIQDLKDESEPIGEKSQSGVTVFTARHPTLGKLVLVKAPDGRGIVVEVDE